MAGITSEECPQVPVAEPAGDSLTDLVAAEPFNILPIHLEGRHDLLGTLHDEFLAQVATVKLGACLELDIESSHVSLSGDNENRAMLLRVDEGLGPDIREIRNQLSIQDTPNGGLGHANSLDIGDALANLGVRTVAYDESVFMPSRQDTSLLTADQELGQDRSLILRNIGATVDLKGSRHVVGDIVRLESHVSANLLATLLHVVEEETLNHALVNEKNVGVEDIDNRRVVNFAAESVEGLIRCTAPEGNVEDTDTTL